mmetsp:Transcript_22558/g.24902  ORF Transcript_22558/g.24902 Transcript_22558/m.24902 type:complete len:480 (-) Transcript_22558:238-1677(-)|eukprot:CAMPEP_0194143988 /NCGR_PEP_ID=MMETSP0152-20130528/13089_1 /TAXON_ID=1049557 /ORGANISM="Thalassiothrix antarctica, Strain L6-D1" /LENGTH=479 /DNA_ID=CAMNT_0038843649 /DNA_START=109 /DNA_END=1548 /DNA_ORIENTATION=+
MQEMSTLVFAFLVLFITSSEGRTRIRGNFLESDTIKATIGNSNSPSKSRRDLKSGKKDGRIDYDFGPDECLICDSVYKDSKPETLLMKFTGDFGVMSKFMDEDDSTCNTIRAEDVLAMGNDDENVYSVTVEEYGIFGNLQVGDVFQFERVGAWTKFSFPTNEENDEYISCELHTSCSAPLVAGDNHGPFQLLDNGSCLEIPDCEICDYDEKPTELVFRYRSKGETSELQMGRATCNEGIYPSSTTLNVNGQSYSVSEGTEFTVTGVDSFGADTDFGFEDGSSCSIHTSCSVPLTKNDVIGPFELLGSNRCPPTSDPQCIKATLRVDVNGNNVVDVEFDYENLDPNRNFVSNCSPSDNSCDLNTGSITDFTPLSSDWIGLYPCELSETEPFAFNVEPSTWTYTCYDEVCRENQFPAVPKGNITFDDETLPEFTKTGLYKPLEELEGCYVVLLNRIDGFSAPPYYNLCLGNTIEFPAQGNA